MFRVYIDGEYRDTILALDANDAVMGSSRRFKVAPSRVTVKTTTIENERADWFNDGFNAALAALDDEMYREYRRLRDGAE